LVALSSVVVGIDSRIKLIEEQFGLISGTFGRTTSSGSAEEEKEDRDHFKACSDNYIEGGVMGNSEGDAVTKGKEDDNCGKLPDGGRGAVVENVDDGGVDVLDKTFPDGFTKIFCVKGNEDGEASSSEPDGEADDQFKYVSSAEERVNMVMDAVEMSKEAEAGQFEVWFPDCWHHIQAARAKMACNTCGSRHCSSQGGRECDKGTLLIEQLISRHWPSEARGAFGEEEDEGLNF